MEEEGGSSGHVLYWYIREDGGGDAGESWHSLNICMRICKSSTCWFSDASSFFVDIVQGVVDGIRPKGTNQVLSQLLRVDVVRCCVAVSELRRRVVTRQSNPAFPQLSQCVANLRRSYQ